MSGAELRFEAFKNEALPFDRLDRHLLVIGQSGSGKSYFLGRLIEEIALKTSARVVVLDRAGDFVKLGVASDGKGPSRLPVSVHSKWRTDWTAEGIESLSLSVHPSWLSPIDLCAAMGLPAAPEYWAPIAAAQRAQDRTYDMRQLRDALAKQSPRPDQIITLLNGIDQLTEGLFFPFRSDSHANELPLDTAGCVVDGLVEWEKRVSPKVHVVDLSWLARAHARNLLALAVLRAIWEVGRRQWLRRHLTQEAVYRTPIYVVIDEAHHLCPREQPASDLADRVRDALIEIAAEGRKYGLWLVIATQRPTRLHGSLVSEASNLLLMRTTAPTDLSFLSDLLGIRMSRLARLERKKGFCYLAGEWSDGQVKKAQVSDRLSLHVESIELTEWVLPKRS